MNNKGSDDGGRDCFAPRCYCLMEAFYLFFCLVLGLYVGIAGLKLRCLALGASLLQYKCGLVQSLIVWSVIILRG